MASNPSGIGRREEPPPNAPNFFLLGGAKCGSTTLYHLLDQHPDLYLAPEKEAHFFNADRYYRKGLPAYLENHFRGAEKFPVRGEATPAYFHRARKVAPRMKATLGGDLRFVIILRDPVRRAWSHYLHQRSYGNESLSFSDALEVEERRWERGRSWMGYFRDGLYARQFRAWLGHYPRGAFRVVLLDELKRDPAHVVRDVFRFLELDGDVPVETDVERNPASEARLPLVGRLLNRPTPVMNLLKRLVPYRLRQRIRDAVNEWNRKAMDEDGRPELDADTERQLRIEYREEIERLEGMIDRDLGDWKPDPPEAG